MADLEEDLNFDGEIEGGVKVGYLVQCELV